MTYHVLNGDILAFQIKQTNIPGECIICAECFIDGPVNGATLSQFRESRARFIAENYNTTTDDYYKKCWTEFEKIMHLPEDSEVCLWFENDLFCQANMWFILSLIVSGKGRKNIFRIFPIIDNQADLWKGFGISDTRVLERAFASKKLFSNEDIQLGDKLWNAYKASDFKKLAELSRQPSPCFQYMDAVCQAHIDRFPPDNSLGRPEKAIKEIMVTKSKDFHVVFSEFSDSHGIYGFGDLQVKKMYDKLINEVT